MTVWGHLASFDSPWALVHHWAEALGGTLTQPTTKDCVYTYSFRSDM